MGGGTESGGPAVAVTNPYPPGPISFATQPPNPAAPVEGANNVLTMFVPTASTTVSLGGVPPAPAAPPFEFPPKPGINASTAECVTFEVGAEVKGHIKGDSVIHITGDKEETVDGKKLIEWVGATWETKVGIVNEVLIGGKHESIAGIGELTNITPFKIEHILGLEKTTVVGQVVETIYGTETKTVTGMVTETVNGAERKTVNGGVFEFIEGGETKDVQGGVFETINGGERKTVNGGVDETVNGPEKKTVNGESSEKVLEKQIEASAEMTLKAAEQKIEASAKMTMKAVDQKMDVTNQTINATKQTVEAQIVALTGAKHSIGHKLAEITATLTKIGG